ncbi:MAG: hypothetical protein NTU62_09110 [Spirochaetes bacterium]|nr:hypothetical protein [Spirochaetota bacterium]
MALVLALTGCGLEIIPILDPPDVPDTLASDLNPVFQVKNYPTTIPDFYNFKLQYGFELYYKFYTMAQSKEINLRTRDDLVGAQFHRVSAPGSLSAQSLPLILINAGDQNTDFDVAIDFNQPVASEAQYNGIPPRNIDLRRDVEYLGSTKTFEKAELSPGDSDVSAIWSEALNDDEIHLAMYAVTYGVYNRSIPLYSTAQYLGHMVYHTIP